MVIRVPPVSTSLPSLLETLAQHTGKSSLIRILGSSEECITYAELWKRSGQVAASLLEQGVTAGCRVAVGMNTSLEVITTLVAIMRVGATIVPLRHRPVLRTGSHDCASIVSAIRSACADWCIVAEQSAPSYRQVFTQLTLPIAVLSLQALMQAQPAATVPTAELSFDAPVLLQFSSGSTSEPKGILITYGNVITNIHAIVEHFGMSESDHLVSWLPLYHDMGLIGAVFAALYAGTNLTLMPPQAFIQRPLSWIETLSRCRATITTGPQFAYNLCLAKSELAWAELKEYDLSSLRIALNGAECVHWESCVRFEEQFAKIGLRAGVLQPAYGLAENCVAVSLRKPFTPYLVKHLDRAALSMGFARELPAPSKEALSLIGQGMPIQHSEIRIRSEEGADLAPGLVGQIFVGGGAATTAFAVIDGTLRPSSADGFVATGDLGVIVDHELFVIGRTKEIFKQGGRTFAPNDIENTLLSCAGVQPGGIAVLGVYNEEAGSEELVILVESGDTSSQADPELPTRLRLCVLRDFQLTVDDVIVVRRGTLPKTSSGKIKRVLLRQRYQDGRLDELVTLHRAYR